MIPRIPTRAIGPVSITLTPADEELCREVVAHVMTLGFTNLLAIGGPVEKLNGARGECAISRAYGVPWSPFRTTIEAFHEPDIGGVDVRATHYRSGGLPFRPGRDHEDRPQALVITLERECRIIGYRWGWECSDPAWFRKADRTGPAWYRVPQDVMRDPAWLPISGRGTA